jgi:hypothetical protein
MNTNAIADALHEIEMMVSVALDAAETMQAVDATPRPFQMPVQAAELLTFSVFDIEQRVKTLRAML